MKIHDINALMKRLASSDVSALGDIYIAYAPKVRSFISHYTDQEAACDLTQDIFLKIWQSRHKLSTILIRDLDSYIFKIAKNSVLDYLKHEKIVQRYKDSVTFAVDSTPAHSIATEEKIVNRSEIMQLYERMQQLSEHQKRIFYMQRAEGMTYNEISRELGISEKTVQYHISSILSKLREPS